MERRYHLSSSRYMVEAPRTAAGRARLEAIRARDSRFKGRRIQDILQAFPSRIKYYRVYER